MPVTTTKNATCRRCRRTLTNPFAVALGLGPGCARHLDDGDLEAIARRMAPLQLAIDYGAAVPDRAAA